MKDSLGIVIALAITSITLAIVTFMFDADLQRQTACREAYEQIAVQSVDNTADLRQEVFLVLDDIIYGYSPSYRGLESAVDTADQLADDLDNIDC